MSDAARAKAWCPECRAFLLGDGPDDTTHKVMWPRPCGYCHARTVTIPSLALDAYTAEQTAALRVENEGLQGVYTLACQENGALREENARLRGTLFDLVEYAKAWRLDGEAAPVHAARALLANPEGQP